MTQRRRRWHKRYSVNCKTELANYTEYGNNLKFLSTKNTKGHEERQSSEGVSKGLLRVPPCPFVDEKSAVNARLSYKSSPYNQTFRLFGLE
jgi:hypothetical protein